ncbi:hypothetical protein [Mycolicibacterium litorale]|uniref:hypothetical protein n=1 Tax=Mycolicibacterium litorale TaxID=758802 RepID=UPI0039A3610E
MCLYSVFDAVAEPSRRALLDELARGERTAGELVATQRGATTIDAREGGVIEMVASGPPLPDERKHVFERQWRQPVVESYLPSDDLPDWLSRKQEVDEARRGGGATTAPGRRATAAVSGPAAASAPVH